MKLLAILALTASSLAVSTQLFKNYCNEDIFVTLAINATEDPVGPFLVPSGQAFNAQIVGNGNTGIVTKNNDTFNPTTAKAILGSSTDLGVLYW